MLNFLGSHSDTLFQVIGVIGFVLYMLPFAAVQLGWMDGNSITFSLTNILAASCVAVSLFGAFNLASALIQGSWIAIGCFGLVKRLSVRRSAQRRFSRLNGRHRSGFRPV